MSQIITKGLLSAKLIVKGFFGRTGVSIDCILIGTVTELNPIGILTELNPIGTITELNPIGTLKECIV